MPGQRFGPAWFPGLIAGGLGVASVIAGLVFYILAADRLGFYITGSLLLTFWMRMLGTSWRWAVVIALLATVAIHLSFYKLLRIPLPWGVLERYAF
jgi:putative tricarboxylic transport membrane protein